MWPDGAWRETWEEYWKAGCSLRRSRKSDSVVFPTKSWLESQESFRWILEKGSVGFPTWKVLAPDPQHPCLLRSPVCLALWTELWTLHYDLNYHIYQSSGHFPNWFLPESEKILQLRSLSCTVASPKFSSLKKKFSIDCQIGMPLKCDTHLMQYRHQNTLFCWFSLQQVTVIN